MRDLVKFGAKSAVLALGLLANPAAAGTCALELILAVDVSGSIDASEFKLQTNGLADAFENPSLIAAIAEIKGGMLVTMTHWSGSTRHRQMTGWHYLTDAASMARFAAEARASGRAWRNYSTAIGEALVHAAEVGATVPESCTPGANTRSPRSVLESTLIPARRVGATPVAAGGMIIRS